MWWRRYRRGTALLKRFGKAQGGVTAIEFAFVGGPFLYLLCVVFETGLMLFSEYVIENGVANAARMIRTGQVQTQSMSAGGFKDVVCGSLATYLNCSSNLYLDVRKFTAFSDITLPPAIKNGDISPDVSANASFQPVKGATSLIGNFPTESELITIAGRVLRISEPSVGSSATHQISPRSGITSMALPLHRQFQFL